MKKKSLIHCIVFSALIIALLVMVAVNIISLKPRIAFNQAYDQNYRDFSVAYLNATAGMRNMSSASAFVYLASQDLDVYIQEMHEIIDERIILLEQWEHESGIICAEPYIDITKMISLEYAYYISKTGINADSEKWGLVDKLFFASIRSNSGYYPPSLSEKSHIRWKSMFWMIEESSDLTDYYSAQIRWGDLETVANAYVEDKDIDDEKKKWIAGYMVNDPYGNLCKRLAENGLDCYGLPLMGAKEAKKVGEQGMMSLFIAVFLIMLVPKNISGIINEISNWGNKRGKSMTGKLWDGYWVLWDIGGVLFTAVYIPLFFMGKVRF